MKLNLGGLRCRLTGHKYEQKQSMMTMSGITYSRMLFPSCVRCGCWEKGIKKKDKRSCSIEVPWFKSR